MKREVTISYNWKRDDDGEIKPEHVEALEETAMNRIIDMMQEGYTSGELSDNIIMTDEDGEDGISYSGLWSINTKNTNED
jgi:hypothetical protein